METTLKKIRPSLPKLQGLLPSPVSHKAALFDRIQAELTSSGIVSLGLFGFVVVVVVACLVWFGLGFLTV